MDCKTSRPALKKPSTGMMHLSKIDASIAKYFWAGAQNLTAKPTDTILLKYVSSKPVEDASDSLMYKNALIAHQGLIRQEFIKYVLTRDSNQN